jgi:membrane associated rhomboid family serine protease
MAIATRNPFMIIPFSTDAPIYHYPRATLGMIVINVAVHVAWSFGDSAAAEPYALVLGAGLHPVQWLSHNFLHADFLHLLFNMVFLWAYGIIVEGKIGWFPFLLLYLAIGTAHGAAIQTAYLGASKEGYVLGASAIVFGLMAICMVWAPVNEISCLFLFFGGFRMISHVIELPIYGFALLQLGMEGVSMTFATLIRGDPMSSAFLHLSGAFWGLLAGLLLLKQGWVDCEGYDILSIWRKKRALRRAWKAREARLDLSRENERVPRTIWWAEERPEVAPGERASRLHARLIESLSVGDPDTSQKAYEKWLAATSGAPPREALLAVVKAFQDQEQWALSVAPMRLYCRLYPDRATNLRLRLASVLIRKSERPTEARRHLEQIDPSKLTEPLRALHASLLAEASAMIEEGVLELEEEDA